MRSTFTIYGEWRRGNETNFNLIPKIHFHAIPNSLGFRYKQMGQRVRDSLCGWFWELQKAENVPESSKWVKVAVHGSEAVVVMLVGLRTVAVQSITGCESWCWWGWQNTRFILKSRRHCEKLEPKDFSIRLLVKGAYLLLKRK